ncbi:hypothetical protein [Catenovulum agarivorans]|uniref:hypothetical protein n=1 Tax=Catenovulum agarivorans TaxID=1172192 RepID=UPI0002E22D00|nr:hypothetical protein [Catenovulum agarivorans]
MATQKSIFINSLEAAGKQRNCRSTVKQLGKTDLPTTEAWRVGVTFYHKISSNSKTCNTNF